MYGDYLTSDLEFHLDQYPLFAACSLALVGHRVLIYKLRFDYCPLFQKPPSLVFGQSSKVEELFVVCR
jgi:hypothetical protein